MPPHILQLQTAEVGVGSAAGVVPTVGAAAVAAMEEGRPAQPTVWAAAGDGGKQIEAGGDARRGAPSGARAGPGPKGDGVPGAMVAVAPTTSLHPLATAATPPAPPVPPLPMGLPPVSNRVMVSSGLQLDMQGVWFAYPW